MKTYPLSQIRKELLTLPATDLAAVSLKMARFRKENKELLSYLLFESGNEAAYIEGIKSTLDADFAGLHPSQPYFALKTVRKILRNARKYARFSGEKRTETELMLHFCYRLKESGLIRKTNTPLSNLYERQIVKIEQLIAGLHEDLRHDYSREVEDLRLK
jgi:hypothetical protein